MAGAPFELSRIPRFAEKVADIIGFYLNRRVAPSCSASTRTPGPGTQPNPADVASTLAERQSKRRDYVRHGAADLFAALKVHTREDLRQIQGHPERA